MIIPTGKTFIFIPDPSSGGGDIPIWVAVLYIFFLIAFGVWMVWMLFHR